MIVGNLVESLLHEELCEYNMRARATDGNYYGHTHRMKRGCPIYQLHKISFGFSQIVMPVMWTHIELEDEAYYASHPAYEAAIEKRDAASFNSDEYRALNETVTSIRQDRDKHFGRGSCLRNADHRMMDQYKNMGHVSLWCDLWEARKVSRHE